MPHESQIEHASLERGYGSSGGWQCYRLARQRGCAELVLKLLGDSLLPQELGHTLKLVLKA